MGEALIIDPEFESIIPPLAKDEFAQLEKNILSEGAIRDPLVVWDGVIIDGHNRYKIIKAHPEIKYTTQEIQFPNRFEAIYWICNNQLGRRNLTPDDKRYVVGQKYETRKRENGGDRKSDAVKSVGGIHPLISPHVSRVEVAQETNTTEGYVKDAGEYARGVDAAEKEIPGIKRELLSGEIKPTVKEVMAIAKAPPEERRQLAEHLRVSKAERDEAARVRRLIKALPDKTNENRPPVEAESIIRSVDAAVDTMMSTCNMLFKNFPTVLGEKANRDKVITVMQKLIKYIDELKGEEDE